MSRRPGSRGHAPRAGEIYFEHYHVGAFARVCAIDAATGTEVVIMGPVTADPRNLEDVALRKLKARLKRAGQGPKGT